jgi:hypothetical protein
MQNIYDAKRVLNSLGEYNADYGQLLEQLEDIRVRALDVGFTQDKVCAGEGVVSVVEVYPQVALNAIRVKLDVIKEMSRINELETPETNTTVLINIEALEDDLPELESAPAQLPEKE